MPATISIAGICVIGFVNIFNPAQCAAAMYFSGWFHSKFKTFVTFYVNEFSMLLLSTPVNVYSRKTFSIEICIRALEEKVKI